MAGAGPALGRIHVPVEGAEKGHDVPLAPPGSSLRAPGATSFDAHSLSAASHALELGQGRGGNEKAWSGRAAGPRALWGRSRHPCASQLPPGPRDGSGTRLREPDTHPASHGHRWSLGSDPSVAESIDPLSVFPKD